MILRFVRAPIVSWNKTFRPDRRAVTALEYALIAATIATIGFVGVSPLMSKLSNKFNTVTAYMPNPGGG